MFSPSMNDGIKQTDAVGVPVLSEFEVYSQIKRANESPASVPGDMPKKLVKEFACELAVPVTRIFIRILHTQQYPRKWVVRV